jgi:hypothetical protein
MSEDVPRHPELDEALATSGPSRALLQVYGDWLLERGHPMGRWIGDGVREEAGDLEARREVLDRYAELMALCYGLVTSAVWDPRFAQGSHASWLLAEIGELWAHPLASLCTSLRVNLPHDPGEEEVLREVLAARPPSVGRLAVGFPPFPRDPALESRLDLQDLRGPPIYALQLRAAEIAGLPPLEQVRELELATYAVPRVEPLPRLEVAHLWDGVPHELVEAVLASPRLQTLGLHLQGSLDLVLGWPWRALSRSARRLWLVGPELGLELGPQLAEQLPGRLEIHVIGGSALPPPEMPLFG